MFDVHVVTHTHWDREWYHPLERFRQRLVALVDELIDDPPSSRESFLLDGQAIVLEDYLDVRPDRAEEIRNLLRDGRLEAGPWFVLADELIPSGEAIVRNLLAGRRALERLGANAPPVLYCPDSFGHPAALPSIAAGFGLPMVLLWRGYGSARWPAGDTARWQSPSGDEVLLFHLPRDGYEFGSHLPSDPLAAAERWQRMRKELVGRSTTGVMLVQNGADHHARQANYAEAIAALEHAGESDGVHRSSLREFAERLVERSRAQRLPLVRGELRDSYGYTWTLQGTFATRAHEKRLNARAERALAREAEPWAALAGLRGRSRRPLVDAAWRTLLTAHPHDTLCGCSIDDVAAAMERRVRSAHLEADGIRDDALLELIGHDPVAARNARDRWQPIVIVQNPAARERGGVAIIDVEEFIADVSVGPGSAGSTQPATAIGSRKPNVPALGTLQVLTRRIENARTESPRHYPDNDLVAVTRVAAWVPPVAGYGVTPYPIGSGDAKRPRPPEPVIVARSSLANGSVCVSVSDDGNVALEGMRSGRAIPSLIDLIDEADVGDTYTPAPRKRDCRIEFRGVRRAHRGPLRGELELRYRVLDRRSVDVDLVVRLTLDAGSPFLRVRVVGDNRRENHRLRLRFRADLPCDVVWADAAFGPVRREHLELPSADAAMEHAPRTAPLHRYVSAFNEASGFTVFSDGLGEYEASADGIAVTLVRSVGELSRNDLPERPGHAGWPASTPAAQCLGPFEAELAVMLHGPRLATTIDAIECAADDFLMPLQGTTLRSALEVPSPTQGVELSGTGLAFSALKESEDGRWLVLRCVNLRDDEVDAEWRLPFTPAEAALARIDETVMSNIETVDRRVRFKAAPRAIVTTLVR